MIACQYGHLEVIKFLTNEKKANIESKSNDGVTPLYIACQEGHLGIAIFLGGKKRANANVQRNNGFTPLHAACFFGFTEVVKFLVNKLNVKIDFIDNIDGLTALDLAIEYGNSEIIKILNERKEKNNKKEEEEKEKEEKRKRDNVILYLAMKKCNFCGNTSSEQERVKLHICSGCIKVNYCSFECQRRDWRERDHKNICPYGLFSLEYRRMRGKEHREHVIAVTEMRLKEKREQFPDRTFVFVPVAETPPFVSGWIPPVSEIDQPIWEPYVLNIGKYPQI